MCEMVDPSTPRAPRVVCASAIKKKLDKSLGDNRKRGYEEQGEELYPGEIFQGARGTVQTSDQISSQVSVAEATKKTQENYLQLECIPYLQSDRIPVFDELICR